MGRCLGNPVYSVSYEERLLLEVDETFGYLSYDDFLLVTDSCSFSDSDSDDDISELFELISAQYSIRFFVNRTAIAKLSLFEAYRPIKHDAKSDERDFSV